MEYHQRSKQTMDPCLMGKSLKHIPKALAYRMENNHTIMAPKQCCRRKIYETNRKTIENNRNRRKELEARVTKVSTPIPLNSSRNYESRSL